MSEPFTIGVEDPVTGIVGSWQERAEELRLAYSERSRAMTGAWKRYAFEDDEWKWVDGDGTDADMLQGGENLQATIFWRGMQDFLWDRISSVFKPGVDYNDVGATLHEPEFNPYTHPDDEFRENFFKWCGGNLYDEETQEWGFRRATEVDEDNDPTMLRGRHEEGDYIGPWISEDLVLAMGHFIRTTGNGEDLKARDYSHFDSGDGSESADTGWLPETATLEYDTVGVPAFAEAKADAVAHPFEEEPAGFVQIQSSYAISANWGGGVDGAQIPWLYKVNCLASVGGLVGSSAAYVFDNQVPLHSWDVYFKVLLQNCDAGDFNIAGAGYVSCGSPAGCWNLVQKAVEEEAKSNLFGISSAGDMPYLWSGDESRTWPGDGVGTQSYVVGSAVNGKAALVMWNFTNGMNPEDFEEPI